MKYFILLLIILVAISYKIAADNKKEFISTTETSMDEKVPDVKKLDLKKIKIPPAIVQQQSTPDPKLPGPVGSDPLPDPADDSYAENYNETNDALKEAKFKDHDENKYRPDLNNDHEDLIREELKKRKMK